MVTCLMIWRPTHPADQLRVREAAGEGRSFGMDIVDTTPVAVGFFLGGDAPLGQLSALLFPEGPLDLAG